jgi:alpha-tubulin suppressor-like RCC1 family protein
MTANASLLLAAVALASCSSASPSRVDPPGDAGGEATAREDGQACGTGNVSCGGVCTVESANACGPACSVCEQPAPSHGLADCVDGTCSHVCEIGYTACGTAGCCGGNTEGDVMAIAAGGGSSCGLTRVGAARCWGDGSYGTLGNGMLQARASTPVAVNGLGANLVMLSLGDGHACAVSSAGALACWGDDRDGQLGDGARQPRSDPYTPSGMSSGVASVAAGASHTCVVTTAGGAKCWGNNASGQLGNGTLTGGLSITDVVGLTSGVVALAAGTSFTCALLQTGAASCWGDGTYGQLGGPASSGKPVAIALGSPAKAIAAGSRHACAVTSDGRALCWGANTANQLGLAGGGATSAAPNAVPGVAGAVAIAAGGDGTCVLDAAGAVTCWGADLVGDLGAGPAGPSVVPSLASGIASLGVGAGHACAVTTGGAPKCWGSNSVGQLGDGTTVDSWVPVDVRGL